MQKITNSRLRLMLLVSGKFQFLVVYLRGNNLVRSTPPWADTSVPASSQSMKSDRRDTLPEQA